MPLLDTNLSVFDFIHQLLNCPSSAVAIHKVTSTWSQGICDYLLQLSEKQGEVFTLLAQVIVGPQVIGMPNVFGSQLVESSPAHFEFSARNFSCRM